MDGWNVTHASARGRAHVAKGMPNQDAVAAAQLGPFLVAAVADGHGAPAMTRADRGAALAVVAMLEVLGDQTLAPPDIGAALVDRWRELVDGDVAADPLDDDDTRLHYGTTAIGARLDDDTLVLVQIGDGDAVVLDVDGAVQRPVPQLPGPWPGGVNSLRFEDATDRVAVATMPTARVELVLLATDGLEAQHGDTWHEEVVTGLRSTLARRNDEERTDLVERLASDAATLGADDTTVAVLLRAHGPAGS